MGSFRKTFKLRFIILLIMVLEMIFYISLLIALFIFVKASEIKVNGKKLLSFKSRLIIALTFPLLILLFVMIGTFLLTIIVIIMIILGLFYISDKIKK